MAALLLACLAQGGAAAQADADRSDSGSPSDAVFVDQQWAWLAEKVGWEDAALRLRLPDATAADILWTQAAMDIDRGILGQSGATADELLAEPAEQLMRKAFADVVFDPFATSNNTVPITLRLAYDYLTDPALRALDSALWATYAEWLHEYKEIRDTTDAGALLFLWARYAMHMDQDAMERLRVSAHDLVYMADYQLARKLAADAHIESVLDCVRCADPSAPYYGDTCGSGDVRRCELPADAPDTYCAAYLKNVVHPAAEIAYCDGRDR